MKKFGKKFLTNTDNNVIMNISNEREVNDMNGFIVVDADKKQIEVWNENGCSTNCISVNDGTRDLVTSLMFVGYDVFIKMNEKDVDKLLESMI